MFPRFLFAQPPRVGRFAEGILVCRENSCGGYVGREGGFALYVGIDLLGEFLFGNVSTTLERPPQRYLVRVFEVSPYRQSARETSDPHSGR
jgi:hypothetical protein